MRRLCGILVVALFATPLLAQEAPVPDSRIVVLPDTDFPGNDIGTAFDSTFEACRAACRADNRCAAFTFNERAGACFSKSAAPLAQAFAGARSALMLRTDPTALARAVTRAAELGFLTDADMATATDQARNLGSAYPAGTTPAADLLAAAARATARRDSASALGFMGAAVSITDAADQWTELARLALAAATDDENRAYDLRASAVSAAINAYLRTDARPVRASALVALADALEATGRGRDMIPALRLAQSLAPRDDTGSALDRAIARYGFHIADTTVESDLAQPRICAVFSEPLAPSGVDYAPFVQLPSQDLSVTASGSQLCVAGVEHGARYAITFRKGLPAASGETLEASAEITQYVRDRTPAVRFPSRAYVLPKSGEIAVPVVTVNTAAVALTLSRVSDRNILRAIQGDYFARPVDAYDADQFDSEIAEKVWEGTGETGQELNREMTTRLPLGDVVAGLSPGVYTLQAAIPGADPYETPPAAQWFVVSDIGLTTLAGIDGLHVTARSLATTDAKPGLAVTLLSVANAVLGTTTTDADGQADFAPGLMNGKGGAAPGLVTATDGKDDLAFLSLTDAEFDLADRGVTGREPSPPIDVFLVTDRGAYRAGETIHATALARDPRASAIEGLPLTARLVRPDGVEYSRMTEPDAGAGGHVFTVPVAGSAPRGPWRLEVYADPKAAPLAATTVLVEDFLPERIDFDLALPDTPLRLGDLPAMSVDARYLFGAAGADLAIEGQAALSAASGLDGYPGYVFGRADEPFDREVATLPDGIRTDQAGHADVLVDLPDVSDPGRPLDLTVTVRVAEGSGRPVERQVTKPVTPAAPFLGIRPRFDGAVAENTDAGFDILALGPNLEPLPLPTHWTLERIETRYQWYRQYGNWDWQATTTRTRVAEGDVTTSAAGPSAIAARVGWGDYELTVERTDVATGAYASASMEFYAGGYAPGDAADTPDTLAVALDAPSYRPGDTAHLRIEPRAAGLALVSVVSNRVIDRQIRQVPAGATVIDVPVTADWGAGAYVMASVIRPMDVAAGHNPARALGLAYAAVDPGARRLAVTIDAPAEAEPRGPLTVSLRVPGVAQGETAYATIAAVDVGILNLTAYKAPDPAGYYFGQRKLGVAVRDIYGRLIDGLNGTLGAVRSGGDAGGPGPAAPPPTEELVAYFTGPVTVGPDGTATATFDLPSFNGSVRVMATVWSRSGVGAATADVLVRDPVVVTASLPRFMAPGDASRLQLEIVHARGPAGRMGLDVTATGVTLARGDVPSGVDLADGGRTTVEIPFTAGDPGIARIEVAVTTPDGHQLVKPLVLPVEALDPAIAATSRFDLDPGRTFTLDANLFAGLRAGTASAVVAAGPIARLNAPGLLATLDRYPYGCTEQLASKALPLLYLSDVARAMNLASAGDIDARIDESITEILANQSSNGAFRLWEAGSGDPWLDAFATDFLSRARATGHAVPDVAFRNAMDNLRNGVNTAQDFDTAAEGGGALAYALMVLAREGAAAVGDLRYYADVKAAAFDTPIAAAQLGAALASYGDPTRADAMFARAARIAAAQTDDSYTWRADYGTGLRDAAAVLALAEESGSTAFDTGPLVTRVAAGTASGQLSTQEATWALLATHALIGRPGADGLTLDGATVTGPLVRVLGSAVDADGTAIRNGGAMPATLTLTTFGVPEAPVSAGGNGYAIARRYYALDGAAVDPATVKAGTRLLTVVEVTPFSDTEARLMVVDPLPAGFEIDNPNLIRGGDVADLGLDLLEDAAHTEFRQDEFRAAVDWSGTAGFRVGYIVRAISPGVFAHPAASVEDMYRPDYRARTDAGTVTVTP